MGTVKYIRVSSAGQNTDRQEEGGIKTYTDKCSGSIAFAERKAAKKLLKDIEAGKVSKVTVHSIDRLGRNTKDILNTVEFFMAHGVDMSSKEIPSLFDEQGNKSPFAEMLITIMAALAKFELERIKERQREGIAKAQARGAYVDNGGRKPTLTDEQFLNKAKNAKCLKLLERGYSLRLAAQEAGVSVSTAQKVKRLAAVAV